MRVVFSVFLSLVLLGCMTTNDGTPIESDGSLIGFVKEASNPGSTHKSREAADDSKCRGYGFRPGTEAYGNCRLQLDQVRTTRAAVNREAASRTQQQGKEGLSMLCKDAILRRDGGGTFVHC